MSACLAQVLVWSGSLVFAGQGLTPKSETAEITAARPPAASVDPRFRSPRATARTFLIAMNRTEDDPRNIEEAVACLDLSGIPGDHRDGSDHLPRHQLRSPAVSPLPYAAHGASWYIPDVLIKFREGVLESIQNRTHVRQEKTSSPSTTWEAPGSGS